MTPTRLFLIDDNALFLERLTALLQHQPCLEIVGQALSGPDALDLLPRIRTDLVLLDVSMPVMNGFDTLRCIRALLPAQRVAMMSMHDDHAYRDASERAGAAGFISKAHLLPQLLSLLDRMEGQAPMVEDVSTNHDAAPNTLHPQ